MAPRLIFNSETVDKSEVFRVAVIVEMINDIANAMRQYDSMFKGHYDEKSYFEDNLNAMYQQYDKLLGMLDDLGWTAITSVGFGAEPIPAAFKNDLAAPHTVFIVH